MTDSDPAIAKNFSLVVGGPFYRALVRVHLVEPAPNIRGRIPVLILLTWMPLLVLSLARGTALGNSVQIPLLRDFSIWARFLLGLPLLIIAEVVIDPWIRRVVSIFESSGIIQDADRPAFHAALEKTKRLRDSGLAELILMILAGLPVFLFFDSEWVSEGISSWHGSAYAGFSPAGWWFAFISSPMIRFLLFRWLWRYGLWSVLLYKIMQLNLDMRPSHPDLLGGLGFVLNAQRHFGILFAAIGTVIAGQYANSITYFGTSLKNIQVPVLAFVLLSIVVVLLPLTSLSPKLAETRRNGLAHYSQLARHLTASFDSRWVNGPDALQESMLGNSDPSSLTDYISCFNVVRDMKIIPINKLLVIQVAAQAAAPFGLLWLLATPVDQIVHELLKMVL